MNIEKTLGEFNYAFQITKLTIFEVSNYRCGTNKESYFTTSVERFTKNKKDFNMCGQCQNELLPLYSEAFKFYEKWNKKHCCHLTEDEIIEVKNDIETLKKSYNFIETIYECFEFNLVKDLSMQKLK